MYDFLLVSEIQPSIRPKSLYLATQLAFNPRWRGSLHHIIVSDISLKTRSFGLHFGHRKFGNIINHFYAVRPKCYQFWRNNENNGHYVQGHSSHQFWYQSKAHMGLPIGD